MLTSADVYVIKIVGYSILSNIARTSTETFLYGTFVVIFFATVTTMIKRGLKSLPSIIVFSTISINFILVSVLWACDMANFIESVKYCLMDQTASTFNSGTIAEFNVVTWHYETVRSALEQLTLTLSDSIVIWRACVLVPRKWVIAFPVLLVVASTACGFARLAILASDFRWFIAFTDLTLSLVDVLLDASLALSFMANTFATLLILHTLWLHLKSRKELGLQNKSSKVLKVLAIIVDTGLAFLLLQGLNIIFSFLPFDHFSAYDFFQTVIFSGYSLLTGMYPTIVIYLVNQQRTLVEAFVLSDQNGNGRPEAPINRTITISALAFAHSGISTETTSLGESAGVGFEDSHKHSVVRPIESSTTEKAHDMV